jgi:acetyl-CoA/propionyl-CoA carboxylase biotin carboxyl carrier protein
LRPAPRRGSSAKRSATASGNDVVSPMHGVVVELKVGEGDAIAEGQVVAVIEAMKMMNEIRAHKAGTAGKLHAAVGATVEAGSPLVSIA